MDKVKLGDICVRLSSGDSIKAFEIYAEGKYPVYGANGLRGFTENKNFEGECVLIGRQGEKCGNVAFLSGEAYLSEHAIVLIPSEGFDTRYLAGLLGLMDLRRLSGQSAQPGLAVDTLKSLQLEIIDSDSQKRVGKLLSNLDTIIQNNKKLIQELEETARLIYDYWFTQFDFPDENGKPYRSSGGKMVWDDELKREIPEGWEVSKAKELAPVITGKEDANFSSTDGKYKFFTCAQEPLACDTPAFEGNAVLIAGNGDFNVKHFSGKFNAYQRTYVIIPDRHEMYYPIYIAAKKQIEAFTKGSAGSIVKFITKSDVENIPIVVPDDLGLFSFFNNILNRAEGIDKENEELIELRKWLLPMLMNGQAKVS